MIGYYVHHQGSGHLNRARAVAAHCAVPVTGLSTLPAPDDWPWPGRWVRLPRDDDGDPAAFGDVTAGGRLHWAPVRHAGLRGRMARIAEWIGAAAPRLLVSDVSVEVALLARLLGTPVAVAAMRGERTDPAHRTAYDLAELLLAPWPAALPEPGWPAHWLAKTVHTGAFSRFDGRPRPAAGAGRTHRSRPRRVLLLMGAGGTDVSPGEVKAARAATPGWRWTTLGGPDGGWSADPWPALCAADVVVTHAGQNALAECAAARRPAVVVPQDRPFGEQAATGRALTRGRLAVVVPRWPAAEEWPALLERAHAHGGARWPLWAPGNGATHAATALTKTAGSTPDPPATAGSATDAPVPAKSATDRSVSARSATDLPAAAGSTTDRPVSARSATDRPAAARSVTDPPAPATPATASPETAAPPTPSPLSARSATDSPATAAADRPATAATDRPATAATDRPATAAADRSATARSVTDPPTPGRPAPATPATAATPASPATAAPPTPSPTTRPTPHKGAPVADERFL
ncbi:glycosyltransferase [Streptomyces sp. NPDC002701]|uniref:glycosyltransferase n=1 Tax=Streptomyces sp. NPDC002701 TaxID=3364661 RepID=UPI00368C6F77